MGKSLGPCSVLQRRGFHAAEPSPPTSAHWNFHFHCASVCPGHRRQRLARTGTCKISLSSLTSPVINSMKNRGKIWHLTHFLSVCFLALSTCTLFCSHHHHPSIKPFYLPALEVCIIKQPLFGPHPDLCHHPAILCLRIL